MTNVQVYFVEFIFSQYYLLRILHYHDLHANIHVISPSGEYESDSNKCTYSVPYSFVVVFVDSNVYCTENKKEPFIHQTTFYQYGRHSSFHFPNQMVGFFRGAWAYCILCIECISVFLQFLYSLVKVTNISGFLLSLWFIAVVVFVMVVRPIIQKRMAW